MQFNGCGLCFNSTADDDDDDDELKWLHYNEEKAVQCETLPSGKAKVHLLVGLMH